MKLRLWTGWACTVKPRGQNPKDHTHTRASVHTHTPTNLWSLRWLWDHGGIYPELWGLEIQKEFTRSRKPTGCLPFLLYLFLAEVTDTKPISCQRVPSFSLCLQPVFGTCGTGLPDQTQPTSSRAGNIHPPSWVSCAPVTLPSPGFLESWGAWQGLAAPEPWLLARAERAQPRCDWPGTTRAMWYFPASVPCPSSQLS